MPEHSSDVPSLQSKPSSSQVSVSQSPKALPSSSHHVAHPCFPHLTPKIVSSLVSLATGDARTALSLLELVLAAPKDSEESSLLSSLRRSVSAAYDRTGEIHYDLISALHKSVRGSQGSAAMYWLARMLAGGEDPLYIARRMIVCASEDIGLADNHALPLVSADNNLRREIGLIGETVRLSLPFMHVKQSACLNVA
jgi:putative ATPase